MAAMTLLLAGLAVSTFAFTLDFFWFDGAGVACLLIRDFFSIDTMTSPYSELNQERKGATARGCCLLFPRRLDPRSE
jgi:hypothetical protein